MSKITREEAILLNFLCDRLVRKYKEPSNTDYILKARKLIEKLYYGKDGVEAEGIVFDECDDLFLKYIKMKWQAKYQKPTWGIGEQNEH